jgi:hypothetical protein
MKLRVETRMIINGVLSVAISITNRLALIADLMDIRRGYIVYYL